MKKKLQLKTFQRFEITCTSCGETRIVCYKTNWAIQKGKRSETCFECSRMKKGETNSGSYKKGIEPWNKGVYNSNDYFNIHTWLRKNYGNAVKCEEENCKGISTNYEWALIKGKEHARDISHYRQMCRSCHQTYDKSA